MSGLDIASIIIILVTGGIFMGLIRMIFGKQDKSEVFDFERDHEQAINRSVYQYQGEKPPDEAVFIGTSPNRKNVFIPGVLTKSEKKQLRLGHPLPPQS